MSLETLREGLPDFAKDTKLNLSAIERPGLLSEQQQWGAILATGAATRNAEVFGALHEEALGHLSAEAAEAALGAASIMAMNNVFYRTRHFLHGAYDDVRAGLRMNIIGRAGGVEKADFDLWLFAVSTVNGCEQCVDAHEHDLREQGVTREQINEAMRIASVVSALAQTQFIQSALAFATS